MKELQQGFTTLFPAGRFRFVLLLLSMLGAFISISELLILKGFILIVTREEKVDSGKFLILGTIFMAFYAFTLSAQYFQRTYRIQVLARSFRARQKVANTDSDARDWALAGEISNVITQMTKILALLIFLLIINVRFGILNILVMCLALFLVGRIFTQQIRFQERLTNQTVPQGKKIHRSHGSRVRAGEFGALVSGTATSILLALLLYLSYNKDISLSNTLLIFFGIRNQNGAISDISRSLMRYAKARAKSGKIAIQEEEL
jgi:hypothetical protein